MSSWNAVGFLASGLVLAAFCMKDMRQLRMVAVASNVAFLTYGFALGLTPVWLLHLVLLPVNAARLWQATRPRPGAPRGTVVEARGGRTIARP